MASAWDSASSSVAASTITRTSGSVPEALTRTRPRSPNAASAKAFLQQNPVTQNLFYLVVETPEGNYCRDIQGIYTE